MSINCEYCCETFNETLKIPLSLSCGHTICKACATYLRIYKIPSTCPFDNKIVSFKHCKVNQMLLGKIKYSCPEHFEEISGICMQHYQKLCNLCMESHQDCEKISGTSEELNQKINELIRTTITENNSKIQFHFPNKAAFSIENKMIKYWYDHCQVVKRLLEDSEKGDEDTQIELLKAFEILNRVKLSTLNQIGYIENPVKEEGSIEKLNKLRQKVDRCMIEIEIVAETQQCLHFFINYTKEQLSNYLAVFYNTSGRNLMITGVGIGVPAVQNTMICVDLEISKVNGEVILREEGKIISSHEFRLTECLELSSRVPFNLNEGLNFTFLIEGENFYNFYLPSKSKMFKIVEIDGSKFKGYLPILYFTTI